MHAIILAAGVGSRLRPETDQVPKCLLSLGRETFLGRLVRQYRESGVEEITVVGGYRSDQVLRHLSEQGEPISFVENRLYDRTNNMFSLALGLRPGDGEVLFGNADVVYQDSLIQEFVRTAPPNSIPVDVGAYLDESMKVELAAEGDRILQISKQVSKGRALGNSLDVYKLSGGAATRLRELILSGYLAKGRVGEWSEVALNDVLAHEPFRPWAIEERWWVEVDTPADLRQARDLVRSGLESDDRHAS